MSKRSIIVLTGGPGGGKTTLVDELVGDPAWQGSITTLPEAISLMSGIGLSPGEKLFQRVLVKLQIALEDGATRSIGREERRIILCNRGSLDPLAYWLARGWPEAEFFAEARTNRADHYQRYAAVIHLVTAADGALEAYQRWPEAQRPETVDEAIRIDRLLQKVWGNHPQYYRIDNIGKNWETKSREAQQIIYSELCKT